MATSQKNSTVRNGTTANTTAPAAAALPAATTEPTRESAKTAAAAAKAAAAAAREGLLRAAAARLVMRIHADTQGGGTLGLEGAALYAALAPAAAQSHADAAAVVGGWDAAAKASLEARVSDRDGDDTAVAYAVEDHAAETASVAAHLDTALRGMSLPKGSKKDTAEEARVRAAVKETGFARLAVEREADNMGAEAISGTGGSLFVGREVTDYIEIPLRDLAVRDPAGLYYHGSDIDAGSPQANALLQVGIPSAVPAHYHDGQTLVVEDFGPEIRFLQSRPEAALWTVRVAIHASPPSTTDRAATIAARQGGGDPIHRRIALASAIREAMGPQGASAEERVEREAHAVRIALAGGLRPPMKDRWTWLSNLADGGEILRVRDGDHSRADSLFRALVREGGWGEQTTKFLRLASYSPADRETVFTRLLGVVKRAKADCVALLWGLVQPSGNVRNTRCLDVKRLLVGDFEGLVKAHGTAAAEAAKADAQRWELWACAEEPAQRSGGAKGAAGKAAADAAAPAAEGPTRESAPAAAPTGGEVEARIAQLVAALSGAGLEDDVTARVALAAAAFIGRGVGSPDAVLGVIAAAKGAGAVDVTPAPAPAPAPEAAAAPAPALPAPKAKGKGKGGGSTTP